jgi:hypothetical protein
MATSQQRATSRKLVQVSRGKESVDAIQVFLHTLLQHHHHLHLGCAAADTMIMWIAKVPTLMTNPWTMPMAAADGVLKLRDAQPSLKTWLMATVRRTAT